MTHGYTVPSQLLVHINRHEFDQLAACHHHHGQRFCLYNRWSHFLAKLMGNYPVAKACTTLPAIRKLRVSASITSV